MSKANIDEKYLICTFSMLTLKKPGGRGGGADSARWVQISLVFLHFSLKLLKMFFGESIIQLSPNFFEKLGMIEIGARGCLKRSSIF